MEEMENEAVSRDAHNSSAVETAESTPTVGSVRSNLINLISRSQGSGTDPDPSSPDVPPASCFLYRIAPSGTLTPPNHAVASVHAAANPLHPTDAGQRTSGMTTGKVSTRALAYLSCLPDSSVAAAKAPTVTGRCRSPSASLSYEAARHGFAMRRCEGIPGSATVANSARSPLPWTPDGE